MQSAPPSRIIAFERLCGRLADALEAWKHAPEHLAHRLIRIEEPFPVSDPCLWLEQHVLPGAILWQSKGDETVRVGIGCADHVRGLPGSFDATLERLRRYLPPEENEARYYGGFSFDLESADDPLWADFGPACFVLPLIEFIAAPAGCSLAVNLLLRRDAPCQLTPRALGEILRAMPEAPVSHTSALPKIATRIDHPEQPEWEAGVHAALDLIEQGILEKIVLARRVSFTFAEPLTPARVMARLCRVTTTCFHFYLQFPGSSATFMGTTPERLFSRHGDNLLTEVIAGTRARGATPEEDQALAADLLSDPKDAWEHEIVRRFMKRRLHLLCDDVEMDATPSLLVLERKQHLRSAIRASCRAGVGDGEILARLHPTPAVGGEPTEVALREIPRMEPFRRGWYAAPVGWVGANACEFSVAIRSGLMRERTVHVFSGAGIVRGSRPELEWLEIEQKISDFRRVTNPS